MDKDFDFKKMSFVVEARGLLHTEQLEMAQSKTANALKKSVASAWELFKTNLESDQVLREKHVAACSGDESRQRAAIIDSLEVRKGYGIELPETLTWYTWYTLKHGEPPSLYTATRSKR